MDFSPKLDLDLLNPPLQERDQKNHKVNAFCNGVI